MHLQIKVVINKTAKYAIKESGDSAEVVERPKGGITALIADGQGTGQAAKMISNLVVSKASALITDGARDGAVARAAHDFLFAQRGGKVSATLTMVSADLVSNTLVISRNSNCPVLLRRQGRIEVLSDTVQPIGFHHYMKPIIYEHPLEAGMLLVAFTDGIYHAGRKYGRKFELDDLKAKMLQADTDKIKPLADEILAEAMALDENRPADDMTLLILSVGEGENDKIRRLQLTYPI